MIGKLERTSRGASQSRKVASSASAVSQTDWVNRDDRDRAPNHVVFRSLWSIDADGGEALDVLRDYERVAEWWGRTFLATNVTRGPGSTLVGLQGTILSRGFLPYRFRWQAEVISATDESVCLSAKGDFEGTGTWRRPRPDEMADLCFDWDVHIANPLLRAFCPIAIPLYLWNHAYAMADGARSLHREILRRRE